MNEAQREWKETWREREKFRYWRHWLMCYRREAALERRIARLERENARLTEALNTAYHDAWSTRL